MSILQITGLTHGYEDKPLYKDAEFELFPAEHIGVVGQNGVGKSTLLKILTGELPPDKGLIQWNKDVKLGFLDQYAVLDGRLDILTYLRGAFQALYDTEQRMQLLYEQSATSGDLSLLNRASRMQEMLDKADFYTLDSEINKVVVGLGISAIGTDKLIGELSGGQRAKIIVAKLLLQKPDVLIMDEPTNFFDKEHVAWLSDYLNGFSGAFIVVSHNNEFLEKIANRILNIENGSLHKYYGKYSEFLKQKEALQEDYVRRYSAQQKVIEKTEEFIRRNIEGVNSKNARGRRKQLANLTRIAPPQGVTRPTISFNELHLQIHQTLELSALKVGYKMPLLPPISFRVANGEKVVITGFNGLGKSTLLRTLMKEIPQIAGTFRFADAVKLGYYEQNLNWADKNMTPMQIVAEWYPKMKEREIRKVLARVSVKDEHAKQAVGTLSGGEQSKVKLAKLLLTPCNFLILDEPTNHFDLETKEEFQKALREFSGSIIMVSHEEAFYRDIADKVFDISKPFR